MSQFSTNKTEKTQNIQAPPPYTTSMFYLNKEPPGYFLPLFPNYSSDSPSCLTYHTTEGSHYTGKGHIAKQFPNKDHFKHMFQSLLLLRSHNSHRKFKWNDFVYFDFPRWEHSHNERWIYPTDTNHLKDIYFSSTVWALSAVTGRSCSKSALHLRNLSLDGPSPSGASLSSFTTEGVTTPGLA